MPGSKNQKQYIIVKRTANGTLELCAMGSTHDKRILISELRRSIQENCKENEEMAVFVSENGWFDARRIDQLKITKQRKR